MRRGVAAPATVAIAFMTAVGCKSASRPTQHGDAAANSFEPVQAVASTGATFSQVHEGMSAEQVRALLASPDEQRSPSPQGPRLVGEAYRWAYGVKSPGSFAARGLVVFDERNIVLAALSPVSQWHLRVPSSDAGLEASAMGCELSELTKAKDGGYNATVTLVNRGSSAFEVRQSGCPGWSQLAISTLAVDGTVLCRLDLEQLCSPYAPGELPTWRFEPGRRRSRELDWSLCWRDFGPLPSGRYLARASFRIHDTTIDSPPVPFEVASTPPVPPAR